DLSLVLGDDGLLAATARALGVRVHVEPMPAALARAGDSGSSGYGTKLAGAAAAAGYLRRLAGAVRAQKPDLIHSTGFKMHLLSAWVVPRRIPILWHVHDYVRSRPMMSRLIRRHAHRCSVAVANSRSVASDLRGVVGPRLRIET